MPDYGDMHGWHDKEFVERPDSDLPAYMGATTFAKLPLVTDIGEIAARAPDAVIVGAPLDDGTTYRPGARFGPRAIRTGNNNYSVFHSLQLGVDLFDVLDVVDAGDANIEPVWLERGYAMIYRKVRDLAVTGTVPIVLGGDHGITWPSATAIAEVNDPARIGMVHFDAHADTGEVYGPIANHGSPMRKLIESGAIAGPNFVQVGLRGYWPDGETLAWMEEQGFRSHFITEIEEHGAEAVVDKAIDEALDGAGRRIPERGHRRSRPRLRPGDGNGRARRDEYPRAPEGGPADSRSGGVGGHGRGRGLTALRPCRPDGDGGQPRGDGGTLSARRQEAVGYRCPEVDHLKSGSSP